MLVCYYLTMSLPTTDIRSRSVSYTHLDVYKRQIVINKNETQNIKIHYSKSVLLLLPPFFSLSLSHTLLFCIQVCFIMFDFIIWPKKLSPRLVIFYLFVFALICIQLSLIFSFLVVASRRRNSCLLYTSKNTFFSVLLKVLALTPVTSMIAQGKTLLNT